MLESMQTPDADGNIIPAGVTSGSVVFSNPKGVTHALRLALNAGTFNVTTGTCNINCVNCAGYTSIYVSPSLYCFISEKTQMKATAYYSDGTQYDKTSSAAWSSSNTTVATVAGGGQMTAESVGTAAISATVTLDPAGEYCAYHAACPAPALPISGGQNANVCDFDIGPGSTSSKCQGQLEQVIYTASPAKNSPSSCAAC